jgi:putative heme-binding domain-containing protein
MIRQGYLLGMLLAAGIVAAASDRTKAQTGSDEAAQKAEVARGEAIFAGKGNCLSCHRVADRGSHLGPDLSAVGLGHGRAELQKELLNPLVAVPAQYQMYRVTTNAGQTFTGRLMNQDRSSIQLLDSTDRLRSFSKDGLRSYEFVATPPMPSYRDKLTSEEQADLISYLLSLKGVVRQ